MFWPSEARTPIHNSIAWEAPLVTMTSSAVNGPFSVENFFAIALRDSIKKMLGFVTTNSEKRCCGDWKDNV